MLRYPQQSASQQIILAPLQTLVNTVPACEMFISFANNIQTNFTQLSPGALQNVSKIARNLAKVFDNLYASTTQSIPSSQYLMTLAVSARQLASQTALAAIVSSGSMQLNLTQGAQNALSTLDAWDAVQGYQAPSNPGDLATSVMNGVEFS